MELERVVLVGLGPLSSIGIGKDRFWDSLVNGRTNVGTLDLYDVDAERNLILVNGDQIKTKITFAAQIRNFDYEKEFEKLTGEEPNSKEAKNRMDRVHHFSVISALSAMKDMHADYKDMIKQDDNNFCTIYSSGMGGLSTYEDVTVRKVYKGQRGGAFYIPKVIINTSTFYITEKLGFDGLSFAPVTACAGAGHATGLGLFLIRSGMCPLVLAGGAEAALTPAAFNGFSSMGALASPNGDPSHASRPFDKNRTGFVPGEGGSALVICSLAFAKRNSLEDKIYCEVKGAGMSSDHYHLSAPRPDAKGMILAMQRALKDASIKPDAIDYISAHGTGTIPNDRLETLAIREVFEKHAYGLAISSQKSMLGHTFAASGGFEAITSALTIKNRIITPTINYEEPDPDCDLDYVVEGKREQKVRCAMSNSFGFGGHNVSIIFAEYEG